LYIDHGKKRGQSLCTVSIDDDFSFNNILGGWRLSLRAIPLKSGKGIFSF